MRVLLRLFCKNVFLVFLLVKKQMECQQGAGKDWRRNQTSRCLTVLYEPFHRERCRSLLPQPVVKSLVTGKVARNPAPGIFIFQSVPGR